MTFGISVSFVTPWRYVLKGACQKECFSFLPSVLVLLKFSQILL